MKWQTVAPNRAISGQYTILKASESGRYVAFYGFTTRTTMPEVLDGFDSWEDAVKCCEAHALARAA